jgi:hypothetical protein
LKGGSLTAEFKISPKLKYLLWAVTVVVWLMEALAARDPLDADAVSYLNIADSCLSGNWHALVNGWWSPGYPFLLALWLKIFSPSPFHHSLAVHMFAFLGLVVALTSFEVFLSAFWAFRKQFVVQQVSDAGRVISDDAAWLMGYCLFFWITAFFTPPSLEQPDILLFVLYLLAAAVCMQLYHRQEWWRYALLGFLLGLGYLVKSVMFPLGFVFLVAVFWQTRQWRFFPRIVLAAAVFVAVSLPFCLALSHSKGRLTFGDVGVLAYRHVMGFDDLTLPPTTIPRPRATPHIQVYSQILQLGTYPPWADPSHGFKGAPFQFSLIRQLNRTHVVLRGYFDIYVQELGVLVCGMLILCLWNNTRLVISRFLCQVVLWLPAFAGLAFYATMRFDPRFLAGYTLALFAACIGAVRIADSESAPRLTRSVTLAVSSLLFLQAAVRVGHEGVKTFAQAQHPDWQVASMLHEMGVATGDRASYMGDALIDHGWAYVAGVKIVSEIPQEDVLSFWAADQSQRVEAVNWLLSNGAKVLVTHGVPPTALSMGWRKVGDTDYYVLPLSTYIRSSSTP